VDQIAIALKIESGAIFAGQALNQTKLHLYQCCQGCARRNRNKPSRWAHYKSDGVLYAVAPNFSIIEMTGKAQREGLNDNETPRNVA
jgi:hypothetical protein